MMLQKNSLLPAALCFAALAQLLIAVPQRSRSLTLESLPEHHAMGKRAVQMELWNDEVLDHYENVPASTKRNHPTFHRKLPISGLGVTDLGVATEAYNNVKDRFRNTLSTKLVAVLKVPSGAGKSLLYFYRS